MVKLFGLQTCVHCKAVREFLQEKGIDFKTTYVDMLIGEERSQVMMEVKKYNPAMSFPTVIIGEDVIVGSKKDKIEEALQQNGLI